MSIRKILQVNNFEPDKTVATMTEEQLYRFIKFTVTRALNEETY